MKKNKKTFILEFARIIKNCQYYEDKMDIVGLTNELGALRGLSYGYQIYHNDYCPLECENLFIYFMSLLNHIKENSTVEIIKDE